MMWVEIKHAETAYERMRNTLDTANRCLAFFCCGSPELVDAAAGTQLHSDHSIMIYDHESALLPHLPRQQRRQIERHTRQLRGQQSN